MRQPFALIVVAMSVVTSCAIREDAAPRNISEVQVGDFGQVATGDAATGDRTIYLISPTSTDEQTQLRSVRRQERADPEEILDSLVRGVNVAESAAGLSSAVPQDIEIASARTVGTRLTIDIVDDDDSLSELSESGRREVVAQIVATATEIDQVQQVRITVGGEIQAWPTGNGDISDEPLTIYDFPGYLESSQPAFTALPTS